MKQIYALHLEGNWMFCLKQIHSAINRTNYLVSNIMGVSRDICDEYHFCRDFYYYVSLIDKKIVYLS